MVDVGQQQETGLLVVSSSPGAGEILGPIAPNTSITIPSSITYTDSDLNIYLNGTRLIPSIDYNYVGVAPRTQVSFTFQLIPGDSLFFEKF